MSDDKFNSQQRPIKPTINPLADLKNTYGKQNSQDATSHRMQEQEIEKEKAIVSNQEEKHLSDIEEKLENAVKNANMEINAPTGDPEELKEEAETLQNEVQTLEFKLDEVEQERDKLKDQLLRLQAEMDNQRRRFIKEKSELIEYANEKLLSKFLEVPDLMEKALESSKKTNDFESLQTGIEMIYAKVNKLFEEAGVKKMDDPSGKEFNYNIHEAISLAPSTEVEEGNVLFLVQDGYYLGEKVLRHAKVITSSGNPE